MSREDFSADALLDAVIDDRFQVIEKLGEGGMGAIYKARQLSVDRIVALKILLHDQRGDRISVERFRHEAYLASRLKHPNAIVIHDFGQTADGLLYIAMEFLSGETLKQRLRRVGPMKMDAALRIMSQTLRTIAEAHRMGMVHRDLKPDNVFLTEMEGDRDFVKVLDFGIAKLTAVQDGVESHQGNLTVAGKIYGTPNYMSPEQIRGKPVEPQSDLYSLGVIFYELIAGRLPFTASTPVDVMMMHLRDLPTPLTQLRPEIPLELERTILRALEKDRRARYQNADEFLEALENYKVASGFYAVPVAMAARARMTPAKPDPIPEPAASVDGMFASEDNSESGGVFHEERTFLEMPDDGPQATPAVGERTFFEADDPAASQEVDDDLVMSSNRSTGSPFAGLSTGAIRHDESTMLELDGDELMEVEPSRVVPIAEVQRAAESPKSTRTGMSVQRLPVPSKPVSAPPAARPGPPTASPPATAEKRTLMGLGGATPRTAPPAPQSFSDAPSRAPSVPGPSQFAAEAGDVLPPAAAPVVRAPPRELNPRPTAVGLPVAGTLSAPPRAVSRTLIVGLAVFVLAGLGVGAALFLDPFGGGEGAGSGDAPVGPPKLFFTSVTPGIEVFDRNLFLAETGPTAQEVDVTGGVSGEPHQLQLVKAERKFKARLERRPGANWVHVRLPDSGPGGELGTFTVRTRPSNASVKVGGLDVGRTPLTWVGSAAESVKLELQLDGRAPTIRDIVPVAEGGVLDVDLAAQ